MYEVLCEATINEEDAFIRLHNTIAPNGYNVKGGGITPPVGEYRTAEMKKASKLGTQRALKGKTYEQIHGPEKAAALRSLRVESGRKLKGKPKPPRSEEHKLNLLKAIRANPSRGMLGKKHKDSTTQLQKEWHNNKVRVVSKQNERLWVSNDDWRCSHPDWQRGLKWKDNR